MDHFDRQHYMTVYRLLAEILERERTPEAERRHLSFALGDLARRLFVGSEYLPPDELLEEVAHLIRSGSHDQLQLMARRLRDHARHLDELDELRETPGGDEAGPAQSEP